MKPKQVRILGPCNAHGCFLQAKNLSSNAAFPGFTPTVSSVVTGRLAVSLMLLLSSSLWGSGLSTAVPGLSVEALESLVAHYDGSQGVETDDSAVLSWTPVDAQGELLSEMKLESIQRGGGASDLISYHPEGRLLFDDTAEGDDGRYLEGTLSNDGSTSFTVIWRGQYSADAPFATSGTYAYNIGPNATSHQRDDGKGGFVVEQYNGTTYAGDDITAYDGMSTIWSSVLSENSHAFYANGENLNLGGMPSYQLNAQASIILGAYSASGYDFVGEIEQFLVFESALSTSDRELIEAYLSSEPGLAAAVPGLSAEALESLVAHYDGSQGVETDDSAVLSWTPVDAQGELLSEMKLESMQRGGGASDLISYHPEGRLLFDDTAEGDDGRYLEGTLSNDGSTSFTVIWRGQYSADAPFATSGTYAYNIGPNATSHQRDDGKGGFVVEQYNGTTYAGDDITAFDGVPTVWSSVLAENSHAFYANGQDLNLGGMPSYQLNAGASIILGAYSASGYDFVGEIEELLIFESALSASDRERIETYLGSTPPDEEEPVVDAPGIVIFREGNEVTIQISEQAHLLASEDLVNWSIIPEAAPELTLPADQGQQFFRAVDSISEISEGMVFRTRVSSDTWREAEYHLDTGAFYFIGEKSHGFDHYTSGGNDLWWCYMNTGGKGSGLIEFLMERNQDAEATKNRALDSGWLAYTGNAYGFLELEALPAQQTLVNHTAPETSGQNDTTEAYSEDYDVIDHKNVYYVLYKNGGNGHLYLGIGGPSLTEQAGALPPGDGSPNRDNGVRGDVAFKTVIPLSDADKQALIETFTPMTPAYNDTSGAYHYMHPEGL